MIQMHMMIYVWPSTSFFCSLFVKWHYLLQRRSQLKCLVMNSICCLRYLCIWLLSRGVKETATSQQNNGHNMMIILTLSYSFMTYFVEYYNKYNYQYCRLWQVLICTKASMLPKYISKITLFYNLYCNWYLTKWN